MMALLAVLVATTVMAGGGIQKMPSDLTLPQSGDSPGKVTFAHASHVDQGKPDCTICHPKLFSILQARSADRKIVHAKMEKGAQCGACHNGKAAFKMDDCSVCHR
jgi:c(7)-type cytochrome triheme protein